jgi:hypothetical protein
MPHPRYPWLRSNGASRGCIARAAKLQDQPDGATSRMKAALDPLADPHLAHFIIFAGNDGRDAWHAAIAEGRNFGFKIARNHVGDFLDSILGGRLGRRIHCAQRFQRDTASCLPRTVHVQQGEHRSGDADQRRQAAARTTGRTRAVFSLGPSDHLRGFAGGTHQQRRPNGVRSYSYAALLPPCYIDLGYCRAGIISRRRIQLLRCCAAERRPVLGCVEPIELLNFELAEFPAESLPAPGLNPQGSPRKPGAADPAREGWPDARYSSARGPGDG